MKRIVTIIVIACVAIISHAQGPAPVNTGTFSQNLSWTNNNVGRIVLEWVGVSQYANASCANTVTFYIVNSGVTNILDAGSSNTFHSGVWESRGSRVTMGKLDSLSVSCSATDSMYYAIHTTFK